MDNKKRPLITLYTPGNRPDLIANKPSRTIKDMTLVVEPYSVPIPVRSVLVGDHTEDPRKGRGLAHIDRANPGMRVGAPQHRAVEHPRHDVVGYVLLHAQHLLA